MRAMLCSILILVGTTMAAAICQQPPGNQDEKTGLPRVLIIGDSISIGYTPFVKEALKGRANVRHNPGNAQHTGTGLKKIDQWLGNESWDVIHFNWGLWDLCYRDPPGSLKRGKENGRISIEIDQYQKNLEKLIIRLKKTGAKLIWASTTFVPEGETGRKMGDDLRYNEVARKLMKKHRIVINDLHAATVGFPGELFRAPGDVHFKPEGRKKLAALVTARIVEALNGSDQSDDN